MKGWTEHGGAWQSIAEQRELISSLMLPLA